MPVWPFGREGTINIRDLQGEFDRLVDRLWHGGISTAPLDGQDWAPPIDVVDESDRFVISLELPGLSPEDVDVAVTGNVVAISGSKSVTTSSQQEPRMLRRERRFGRFKRSVELPDAVDDSRVQATFKNGVLTVSLPKHATTMARRVPVEGGD